jgi:hypothetical protein
LAITEVGERQHHQEDEPPSLWPDHICDAAQGEEAAELSRPASPNVRYFGQEAQEAYSLLEPVDVTAASMVEAEGYQRGDEPTSLCHHSADQVAVPVELPSVGSPAWTYTLPVTPSVVRVRLVIERAPNVEQ